MHPSLLARGFVLGFSIAAVVGPIALLCVRRTLATGFAIGFASGLGAATADASYAAIASFGVTALASLLIDQRLWLRLIGGAFLIYLGVRTLRAMPAARAADSATSGLRLAGAYSSTLGLTLSNPMTIMSFAAIFAGIGASSADLVLGVFIGSATWWLVLAGAVSRLRTNVTPPRLRWVNIASGVLILGFGVESMITGVLQT
ncbi:MAG: LysE family transporter [Chloroflexi bacterium]|nr:LysE family transporter [Chloroflexota bacterium]